MKNSILNERVNFAAAVTLIGSAALLGIVSILEVADERNPIADIIATTVYAEIGE